MSKTRSHSWYPTVPLIALVILCGPAFAQYENRGDINLNGVPFELADAAIFADYFDLGLAVFTIDLEAQIAATDIDMDGLTLSVADYVAMLRVIWGEGDPPVAPEDSLEFFVNVFDFDSSARVGLATDTNTIDQALFHFSTAGNSSAEITVLPAFEGVSVEYEFSGANLIVLATGLRTVNTRFLYGLISKTIFTVSYDATVPEIEYIGGLGVSGEALTPNIFVGEFQLGDVNMNGWPYDIGDAVLLTNAIIYGDSVFINDWEFQMAASDINQDGVSPTIEDQELILDILVGEHDPGDPVGDAFSGWLIEARGEQAITLITAAEDTIGALYFRYLAPGVTDYAVTLTDELSDMIVSYDLVTDTLRTLIYSLGDGYIKPSATRVGTITFTGEMPELALASSAGNGGESVDLSVLSLGDANGDGEVDVGDAVTIINYVFGRLTEIQLWQPAAMDANCDGVANIGDAVYLVNHIFRDGPPPDCQ